MVRDSFFSVEVTSVWKVMGWIIIIFFICHCEDIHLSVLVHYVNDRGIDELLNSDWEPE